MPDGKKIVIVIESWNEGNGCVVATKRLKAEFEKRGYSFEIIVPDTTPHDAEGFHEVPGFYLPGVKESLQNMGMAFGKGKRSVYRKVFKDADLVMIQFPMFMARNAVTVARKMGVPVMGSCHLQPQNVVCAAGLESPFMAKMLHKLFHFCLYSHADVLHCPSNFAAQMLRDHGSKAHFRVVSNGIPREYVSTGEKRPDWFGDKFVILNIGRYALEKRQELLIDGILNSKYKDNIQLILAGKGEDEEKLLRRGKELPVKPLIEYISAEDKLTYLNTADMYLHSSIVELESLSCLEAVGCGLPCLISDSPDSAAPQFALDDRFLFSMDNAEELGKKIDYWYENRVELNALKAEVLKMAEYYRMDRCIDEMEDLFNDVISSQTSEVVLEPGILMGRDRAVAV